MPSNLEPSHGPKSARGKPPDEATTLENRKIDPSISRADLLKKRALKQPLSEEENLVLKTEERYDKLNSLWKKAEEQIKRFMVSKKVMHVYETTQDESDQAALHHEWYQKHCIAWAKAKGAYRLCYGFLDESWIQYDPNYDYSFTPILDASLEIRKTCVPFFPELRKKVVAAATESLPELDATIAQLSQALE